MALTRLAQPELTLDRLVLAATGLGLDRLAAVTDVPNAASDRMARRAGFVPLGETDGPRHRLRSSLWSAPRGGRSAATA